VDVARVFGAVVLGPALEVRVLDYTNVLEQGQGPVHGGRVDRGKPALDPAGHVLRGYVSVGAENFREDGLALGRDAVAALPEHGHHRPDPVHAVRLLHGRCGSPPDGLRPRGLAGAGHVRDPTGL